MITQWSYLNSKIDTAPLSDLHISEFWNTYIIQCCPNFFVTQHNSSKKIFYTFYTFGNFFPAKYNFLIVSLEKLTFWRFKGFLRHTKALNTAHSLDNTDLFNALTVRLSYMTVIAMMLFRATIFCYQNRLFCSKSKATIFSSGKFDLPNCNIRKKKNQNRIISKPYERIFDAT